MRSILIVALALALYASPSQGLPDSSRAAPPPPTIRANEPPTTIYVERAHTDPLLQWLPLFFSGIAIGWNIVVYVVSGPRLKVAAEMDMLVVGIGRSETDERTQPHVTFQVANRGDRPTTLYNAGFVWFPDWRTRAIYDSLAWLPSLQSRLAGKRVKAFLLTSPWYGTAVLPFLLNPGTAWNGHADQDADVLKMEKEGMLYVRVYHYGGPPARGRITRRPGVS